MKTRRLEIVFLVFALLALLSAYVVLVYQNKLLFVEIADLKNEKVESEKWVALNDPELTLSVTCLESVVENTTVEVPYNHPVVNFFLSWKGDWEDVWFQFILPEGESYLVGHVGGGGGGFSLNGLVDGDIIHDEYPPLLLLPGRYVITLWSEPYSLEPMLDQKAFQVDFFIPECG